VEEKFQARPEEKLPMAEQPPLARAHPPPPCSEPDFPLRMEIAARLAGNATRLAELSGISRRAIGDYLAGTAEPTRRRLLAIAKAAGVSVQWLAVGDESLPPSMPAAPSTIGINIDLIEDAIAAVEEYLEERGHTLCAGKRAQAAAILISLNHEQDEKVVAEAQERLAALMTPAPCPRDDAGNGGDAYGP